MKNVSVYSGMIAMVHLLVWDWLAVFDVVDDCGADDSGSDGEDWEEHGVAPLLRFVVRKFSEKSV